ncbi:MAG: TlpA family protein disulfide reductase [Deltaproteobacteria bacterium]|nr:TlpA family protein disulfide reductase [Deltaproteobacteria bacterium]
MESEMKTITNYELRIPPPLSPSGGGQGEENRKSKIVNLKFLCLLTAYCLLFTVFTGCGQKAEEDGIRKTLPKEGDAAGAFSLKLIDGNPFKLSDAKGNIVVINFFASWCHPCKIEAPALQRVYAKYKQPPQSPFNSPLTKGDKGVIFIGVAIQDTEKKVMAYTKEFGIQFPVGIDNSGNIAEAYKIYGIPKTFIIDKDGRFSYIHMGEITEADLIKGIEKALK